MKFKHSNSIFWEYVFVCAMVALISCLITGFLLGSIYLRFINARNEQMLQDQSVHAAQELDSQVDSMHQLSIRLSVQRIYRADHIFAHKYNVLNAAQSIIQYQSYCPMSSQFVLVYRNGSETLLLQKDGTTTDISTFLRQHLEEDTPSLQEFLLSRHESGTALRTTNALLFAYPLRNSNSRSEVSLFFVVPLSNLQERIRLTSSLQEDSYRLVYQGMELISHKADNIVSSDAAGAFRIDAEVPHLSLQSLMDSPKDILLLALCLLFLFVSIFALAWRCYRPIRSLSLKHSGGTTTDIKNELQLLDQVIIQTRDRSQLLDQKASDQSALLQDYVLLMLLNNSGSINIVQDLANAGIDLPNSHFAVITLTPCKDQIITQENIDTLQQNLLDVTGDIGSMYVVKCSHTSHILAIICNPETPELYEVLIQRLHTYLGTLARRFLVGTGPLTDRLAGISASYLTALSQLRTLANAQPPAIVANAADTGALINRIVSQIECGDCPQALVNLEAYMAVIEQNQSELIRRSNVLSITLAIQQLCGKLNFRLTESQMGMLLSMRSVKTIHFALLQLIPPLCIHAQKQNDEAILPTGRLVMDYLNNHFSDYDISVQQVAEAVGIGINRTSAIIREATGHSFKTVLAQLRITQAKKLLSSGSTVADVASQVGYNSASYFIKVFKSAEGITPDAYRKSRYGDDGQPETPDEEDP